MRKAGTAKPRPARDHPQQQEIIHPYALFWLAYQTHRQNSLPPPKKHLQTPTVSKWVCTLNSYPNFLTSRLARLAIYPLWQRTKQAAMRSELCCKGALWHQALESCYSNSPSLTLAPGQFSLAYLSVHFSLQHFFIFIFMRSNISVHSALVLLCLLCCYFSTVLLLFFSVCPCFPPCPSMYVCMYVLLLLLSCNISLLLQKYQKCEFPKDFRVGYSGSEWLWIEVKGRHSSVIKTRAQTQLGQQKYPSWNMDLYNTRTDVCCNVSKAYCFCSYCWLEHSSQHVQIIKVWWNFNQTLAMHSMCF